MGKIKIGLLLDSLSVKTWQYHIVEFISNHPDFEIELLIVNQAKKESTTPNKYFVYKLFRRLDRKIFKIKTNLFGTCAIPEVLKKKVFFVMPRQGKTTDEIVEPDVARIRTHQLDVIVRFGFRILKGEILSAARLGVWSLHHGDNEVNRGGPPAFWEVVNHEPVTGVTLLKLSEDLDGGTVLGKSFAKTDHTSFHRNQTSAYWAGIELFCASLESLVKNEEEFLSRTREVKAYAGFYSRPLYHNPKNLAALRIFTKFWLRRLKELIVNAMSEQQWSLSFHRFRRDFETSLFRYKSLTPPKGVDWADPFVISSNGSTYVFFEEFVRKKNKAHISVLELNRNGQLISKSPVKVLNEQHHLSYPFITDVNGKFYMTVESAEARKVSLYECEKFPNKWTRKKDILEDIQFYDPTLYHHQGLWYLFGNIRPWEGNSANQYLAIYYSEDLLHGTWKPHRLNPVSRDVRGARPAGKIHNYKGRILRPSQIGAPKYGYGVKVQEIVKLSPTEYAEVPVEEILPLWGRDLLATHTFNFDHNFLFIDVQKRKYI